MSIVVAVQSLSHGQLFVTPWTIAHQAPLSMGFSRPEYWHELPFPSPGDLPDQEFNPCLLHWPVDYHSATKEGPPCVYYFTVSAERQRTTEKLKELLSF